LNVKNEVMETLQSTNRVEGNSYYFFNENSRLSDLMSGDIPMPTNHGPGGMERNQGSNTKGVGLF
jgi:hypothetical protein